MDYGLLYCRDLGGLFVEILRRILYAYLTIEKPNPDSLRVPPWLTGVVERLVFTFFVGYGMNGTATAMMAWIGFKMLTNWNRPDADTRRRQIKFPPIKERQDNARQVRAGAFIALLLGLMSMLFALLGGQFIYQRIPPRR